MKTQAYAPGRVEWLGNHTDYNDGFVLAAALDVGTNVKGRKRTDGRIILTSKRFDEAYEIDINQVVPIPEKHWANYPLGVVEELKKAGYKIGGFEAVITGKVPIGAGLASSAALEVSTAIFLKKLYNLEIDNIKLAKMAQSAEHCFAGVRCGLLDQVSSLMSEDGKATVIDFRSLKVKNVTVPDGYKLVIINSGVKHALVAGEYNERRASCEAAAKKLGVAKLRDINNKQLEAGKSKLSEIEYKRAKHIVGENERVLLAIAAMKAHDIEKVGKLMQESHKSSQQYFENSCKELDFIVENAMEQPGCLGSRLSGGGFGGATINLVESDKVDEFSRKMFETYKTKFNIEPLVFVTRPSGGAK